MPRFEDPNTGMVIEIEVVELDATSGPGLDALYALHRRAVIDLDGNVARLLESTVWDDYQPWQRLSLDLLMDAQTQRVIAAGHSPESQGLKLEDIMRVKDLMLITPTLASMVGLPDAVFEVGLTANAARRDDVLTAMERLGLMRQLTPQRLSAMHDYRQRVERMMREGCPGCPNCRPEAMHPGTDTVQ